MDGFRLNVEAHSFSPHTISDYWNTYQKFADHLEEHIVHAIDQSESEKHKIESFSEDDIRRVLDAITRRLAQARASFSAFIEVCITTSVFTLLWAITALSILNVSLDINEVHRYGVSPA